MTHAWDPTQYLAFAEHRLRPALELLLRIPHAAPARIADLGCGTGNVTAHLRRRWPEAAITGVDNSPQMLAQAAQDQPAITWQEADLESWWPAASPDVIYANASLHWVSDQEALFTRLMGLLAPGGVLAAQMPRNFGQPSHTLMREVADSGPWAARLKGVGARVPVEGPEVYHRLLAPHSERLDIWETRYLQVMTGENPVADFTKGSWLKQMLDALDEPQRGAYEAEYRRRIQEAYPKQPDGSTLFPFTRLFIVAVKPGP